MTTSRIEAIALARSTAANSAYFPALDGLRAVAFLMVFGTHYLNLPWGWTGVNVFFVLSGFLITGILFDTREQPNRVFNFYLRRTLRIFPLYYGLILLLVLGDPIFRWEWNWHWLIWPAYLGNMARCLPQVAGGSARSLLEFAQPLSRTFPRVQLAFGHFWSLCVEEQFYLLWPWVVFGFKGAKARGKLLGVCAAGIVGLPLLRVLATHTLSQAAVDNGALLSVSPLPFDALLLGAVVALVRRGPHAGVLLPLARIGFVTIAVAFIMRLAINPAARDIAPPYPYPAWTFTWGLSLIDVASACVMVMALERGSLAFRLMNVRPLRWLGRVSYGAYVFHDILHGQIARLVQHFAERYTSEFELPTAALAFAITLVLAWASFRWFEAPFIRLKDRWSRSPVEDVRDGMPELVGRVA